MAEGRRLSPRSGIFDGIHTLTPQTIVYVGSDGEVLPLNLGNGLSISNDTLNLTGSGTIDANAINVGTGVGLYKQKVDTDLHFKTLVGNSKMVIDLVGADEVRLNVVNVADQIHTHTIADITNLQSSIDSKVDVVSGKGLSTNDFSNVYRDLVDMLDQYLEETGSGLHVSGGEITPTGGTNFTISPGVGYAITPLGEMVRVTWPQITSSCQNDGDNYMTIDYQGNLVQYASTAGHENIRLGYVRTGANNTLVVGLSNVKFTGAHHLYNINQWASTILGSLVDDGCNLALKPSPNDLEVVLGSGRAWAQFNKYNIADTDTFTKIFNSSVGYIPDNVSTPNQIVPGVYNNPSAAPGSALVPMTSGFFKKDMFFITIEGTLFYVYGTAEYATLDLAKAAPVPAAPDNIKNQIIRVGAVVSQEGATTVSELQDIRPIFARLFDVGFVASNATVINHSDLIGLANDDHTQYHTDVRGDVRYYRKTEIDSSLSGKQDINVNLTNISSLTPANDDILQYKAGAWTNRTVSQLKADFSLTKSDVGLSNVDNTSDLNKPISTATQSALDGKQITLISGTNLRTINGTTLLGSGDLLVSAAPSGSSTHIQFNDGGSLAGSSDFTWDNTTKSLSLLGNDTEIIMQGITNEPAAAPAGSLRLYTKNIAGRILPKWVGPAGVDTPMQANVGFNRAAWVIPNTTTSVTSVGIAVTNTGTVATPTLTSTNTLSSIKRSTFTTATTAGSLAGTRSSAADWWRGNASGRGGFFINIRFGLSALQAGNRSFVGLETTAAAPTNIDPLTSTTNGRIGMAINANTGNWNIVHNVAGTIPTSIDLGSNFPVNAVELFELTLFAAPFGSNVGYRVKNLVSGIETTGTLTTNIPSSTTFMAIQLWITNNATAAAAGLAMSKIYIETDL